MFLRIFNASLNIFTTMNQCNMIKKRINLFICFFSLESSHRYSKIFLVHSFIHLNWSHSTQQTKLIKFNYFTVREFLLIKLIATVCIPHWSISSILVNCITLFAFCRFISDWFRLTSQLFTGRPNLTIESYFV